MVDLMTPFWTFWDQTQSLPQAERVARFKQEVVLPGLPVYADGQFRRDLSSDANIAKYLDTLQPMIPQMRVVTEHLRDRVPAVAANVIKNLPGMSTDRIQIYFMPSFLHFNGQTHDIGDGIGVLFGVDGMVKYGSSDENLGVDVAHELFHIYQFEMHPGYHTDEATLWQAVWGEGSAAYASQVLTPGATMTDALDSSLASANAAQIEALACGIKGKWSSRDADDMAAYLDAGSHPPALPPRGGYLIGYLVARDLARTHTVAELGKYDLSTLEPIAQAAVVKLCANGTL